MTVQRISMLALLAAAACGGGADTGEGDGTADNLRGGPPRRVAECQSSDDCQPIPGSNGGRFDRSCIAVGPLAGTCAIGSGTAECGGLGQPACVRAPACATGSNVGGVCRLAQNGCSSDDQCLRTDGSQRIQGACITHLGVCNLLPGRACGGVGQYTCAQSPACDQNLISDNGTCRVPGMQCNGNEDCVSSDGGQRMQGVCIPSLKVCNMAQARACGSWGRYVCAQSPECDAPFINVGGICSPEAATL